MLSKELLMSVSVLEENQENMALNYSEMLNLYSTHGFYPDYDDRGFPQLFLKLKLNYNRISEKWLDKHYWKNYHIFEIECIIFYVHKFP